jgi:LPS export ABC transporter protein LptC
MFKKISLVLIPVFLAAALSYAEKSLPKESDQQISDFSLSGYGEKGKKSWDLSGKTADIFTDIVKLKDIVGNLYKENENIHLVADTGDFDKKNGKVHLEKNVIITTSSGARMSTDSLDWDRKSNTVVTEDSVSIERQNMVGVAQGAKGEPGLNRVMLAKDVEIKFNPAVQEGSVAQEKNKIVITCDGPLEIDYEKNIAVFNNNVKVTNSDSEIYSDKMDVYFNKGQESSAANLDNSNLGAKVERIVARGNVKIVRGENVSYSEEAVYTASERKITLSGRPKLIIYSSEGLNASP